MTPDVARIVILGTAALGWGAWLVSVVKAYRLVKGPERDYRSGMSPDVTGNVRVPGKAVTLSKRFTDRVASMGIGYRGMPCRILESTSERVRLAMPKKTRCPHGTPGETTHTGMEVTFRESGDGVEVSYLVDMSSVRQNMGTIALCINVLGLAAVTVLPAFLYLYVASHSDPGIRWQSVQAVQMAHFLWPPYLFLWMYRRAEQLAGTAMKTIVSNLEHGGPPPQVV